MTTISLDVWEVECEGHILFEGRMFVEMLEELKKTRINFLDIGANIGKMYDYIHRHIPIGVAHLVEPSPFLFDYINQKYADHPSVHLYNWAMGDKDEMTPFYTPDYDNITDDHQYGVARIIPNGQHQVQMHSVDGVFEQYEWKDIDVVKIDTENYDYQILSKMVNFVKAQPSLPIILFEENSSWTQGEKDCVINALVECGYTYKNYDSIGLLWQK
jgi:FkbM family methyltransferase